MIFNAGETYFVCCLFRHSVDVGNIFCVQFTDDTDSSGAPKTTFVGQCQDLFFGKVNSQIMDAGRHADTAKMRFHRFDSGEGTLLWIIGWSKHQYI